MGAGLRGSTGSPRAGWASHHAGYPSDPDGWRRLVSGPFWAAGL